jgi:hypothetical protein
MNMVSGVGYNLVFNVADPLYADISPGYAYAIVLVNQTAADITAGTFTVQHAPALASDPCAPDPALWTDVQVMPDCANPAGVVSPATVTFTATAPLAANSQCQYAFPCVQQFVKVVGAQAGVSTLLVLDHLKRIYY